MMQLPPQAYTKETLIQAYNWLRSQPANVQELAKSPDALVALYTRAQMHGDNSLSRMNLQGFKSELKNLATMMGELEEAPASGKGAGASTKAAATSPQPPTTNVNLNAALVPNANLNPAVTFPPVGAMMGAGMMGMTTTMNDPSLPLFNAAVNAAPTVSDLRNLIDARSWTMIQEVKNHFNLSSEHEAIRLLVAMGYQKMRSQF